MSERTYSSEVALAFMSASDIEKLLPPVSDDDPYIRAIREPEKNRAADAASSLDVPPAAHAEPPLCLSCGFHHLGACPSVPAMKSASRPWYDGAGKEKRLRVKGLVDLAPPNVPERSADAPDPGDVAEIHRASEKAMAEGDERALGKLYEDLLDELHSTGTGDDDAGPNDPWLRLRLACPDFEPALAAEMRTLASADARWGWAYRLVGEGLEVLMRDPEGEGWACAVDLRALLHAAETYGDPRRFAEAVIGRARREILSSRTGALLGRSIPLVGVA